MIRIESLTKSYRLPKGGRHYVFRDLNFTLPEGQNIGILGRNGAGKSTLMRIIAGIDYPDSGRILTNKSISWPIGLVGGLQGTLSGRENVRFVCRINGLTREATREKEAFVEEFADIGRYFDVPIKSYSSGMRSRVTFGLSLAFDFDYYLIDEVGAVGDKRFKEKSEALFDAKKNSANLIMVNHNLKELRERCHVFLVLHYGQFTLFNDANDAIGFYSSL